MCRASRHASHPEQDAILSTTGTFFAFSKGQVQEGINKNGPVKHTDCGHGMFCPSANVEQLTKGLETIYVEGIAQDKLENGKAAIIERELSNYECYYTGDIEDAVHALAAYGYTIDDVREVYRATRDRHDD